MKRMKIVCKCGEEFPWDCYTEHGRDTIVDERHCNGISCDYFGCPGDFCYMDHPKVNVAREFVRVTCPKCEYSEESVLHEEVTKA